LNKETKTKVRNKKTNSLKKKQFKKETVYKKQKEQFKK